MGPIYGTHLRAYGIMGEGGWVKKKLNFINKIQFFLSTAKKKLNFINKIQFFLSTAPYGRKGGGIYFYTFHFFKENCGTWYRSCIPLLFTYKYFLLLPPVYLNIGS